MRSEECGAAWGRKGRWSGFLERAPVRVEGFLQTPNKSLRGDALGRWVGWGGRAARLPAWSGHRNRAGARVTALSPGRGGVSGFGAE